MTSPTDRKPDPVVVEEEIIPVVEERVHVTKTVHEGRTVTVRTRPVTETVSLSAPLTREHVSVERVPIDRIIDEMPGVREEGDVTIIPVVEERPRVVIDLVLREETHLRRTREVSEERLDIERRTTEIEIED